MTGAAPLDPTLPAACEVVVIGAGIAGLAAAWHLRDRDVLVLEAAERPGGRIRSEPRGDYWLNLAAHIFAGPDTNLGRLVTEAGLETVPVPGNGMGTHVNGRLVAGRRVETYPLRLRASVLARLSLAQTGLKIRRGVKEYLALAEPRPDDPPGEARRRLLAYRDDTTFSEYLGTVHRDVAALLRAAINRVSAEPEVLSAGAGIAQFAATFNGGTSLYHRNLPGGSSRLVERLAERLGDRLHTGVAVGSVANTGDGVLVTVEGPNGPAEVRAKAAVVATPAPVARRIVQELPPATARALESIRYGPYVVASFLTNESRPMPWDDLYAVVVARKSFNMFFNNASTLRTGPRRPGGSLTVYGASTLGADLLALSDDEVVTRFRRDLGAVFPDTERIIEEVIVQRWPQGIPYSTPGRSTHQRSLEQPLDRIVLAGDYIGERGGMDTAATTGLDAATAARALLAQPAPVAAGSATT